MKILKEVFGNDKKISNVTKKGKCIIAKVDEDYIVLKEKNNHNINETYDYLISRGFSYFPKIKYDNYKYNLYEYIKEVNVPLEQKAFDMMNLLSLLHNKTTFYKEMDMDEYKGIYEGIINKINNTITYYDNLMNIIESHVFMSPSEYLIARNISKIYGALNYAKITIDKWYNIIKVSAKKRVVLLYNNIDLDHVIRNKELYLINFEKTKQGIPIYDLYDFYKKYAFSFDFVDLIKYYESKYPLLKEEKLLFYTLISIPDIIKFTDTEINNCKTCKDIIDLIYKSEVLISKNTEEGNSE